MKEIIEFARGFETIWEETKQKIKTNDSVETIFKKLELEKKPISEMFYSEIENTFGVYIFYIKPTKKYNLSSLKQDWNDKAYIKYPNIIQTRFEKHLPIKTSTQYPFYIGKSEKLGSRVRQHINQEKDKTTYGLKLKGRRYFNIENITFSYWKLPEELANCTKEIKQFIITQIESELRNKLNPWIGKQ